MKIQYIGHSCFLIELQGVRIVTDPYGEIGFPMPRLFADVVTVSHSHYDHCNVGAVTAPKVLSAAGEYEVGGVRIVAKERSHDEAGGRKRGKTLVFRFEGEGLSLLHMGDIGEPCSRELFGALGRADVMLLPVGGNYTIDDAEAYRYATLFRPSVLIPMHYMQEGLTVDISDASGFLRRFGQVERVGNTVTIEKEACKDMRIFYMERSRMDGKDR